MIVVTIDLWPLGIEANKKHLGTAYIANNLEGTVETGNYTVKLTKWNNAKTAWKKGSVRGFPRLKLGAWDLLFRALLDTVGSRNQEAIDAR